MKDKYILSFKLKYSIYNLLQWEYVIVIMINLLMKF